MIIIIHGPLVLKISRESQIATRQNTQSHYHELYFEKHFPGNSMNWELLFFYSQIPVIAQSLIKIHLRNFQGLKTCVQ